MKTDIFYQKDGQQTQYGFKNISSVFCSSDETSLNFSLFTTILPNVERIIILNDYLSKWKPTISLNESFKTEILKTILSINKASSLSSITIVNPTSNVLDFANKNKSEFNKYGWNLQKEGFQDFKRPQCPECAN
eukprot:531110_1